MSRALDASERGKFQMAAVPALLRGLDSLCLPSVRARRGRRAAWLAPFVCALSVLVPSLPALAAEPGVPAQGLPAHNEHFEPGEAQVFSVTATDFDNDAYHGRIDVTPATGGATVQFDLSAAPSGQSSTGTPPDPFGSGTYTWVARACEVVTTVCGGTSSQRTFTVGSPGVNQPPRAPVLNSPAHNKVFAPGETQVFSVTSTDDDGDPYRGRVTVYYANGYSESFDLSPAPSGVQSAGSPPNPLAAGSYTWTAKGCDENTFARCGPSSTPRAFTVQPPPANVAPGSSTMQSPADGHAFDEFDPQTFVINASDPELDQYVPTVEVSLAGSPVRTRLGEPTLSGQDAAVTVVPSVGPGSYTWRARACEADERTKCGPWTATRAFVVTVANRRPALTALVAPADEHVFPAGAAQEFRVTATDEDGDDFVARVQAWSRQPASSPVAFTSAPAPSGATAVAVPPTSLPPGAYSWRATACVSAAAETCGDWSDPIDFSVAGQTANAAPGSVSLLAPEADAIFAAGERQDFTVQASDPDGEPVTVELRFRRALDGRLMPQRTAVPVTATGTAIATLATDPLPPGAYIVSAQAFDARGGVGVASEFPFGVAATGPATPCDGVEPLVDGWFGDHYLRFAHAQDGDTGYLCLRSAGGAEPLGGWVRAETASGASPGAAAACPLPGDDTALPFPLVDTGEGPERVEAWARRTGTTVTVCLRVTAAGGALLDTSMSLVPPTGTTLGDLSFVPEAPDSWTVPAPESPSAGLPSSACQESADGTLVRVMNAQVDGRRLALHRLSGADQQQLLCARVEGDQSAGLVVSVVDATGVTTLVTNKPADDETSPCTVPALHENQPIITRLAHTSPSADPVGICLYAGIRVPAEAGVSAWLLVDRSPAGALPSVTHDP